MVGRNNHRGNWKGLRARYAAMGAPVGRIEMIIRVRVGRAAVSDAMSIRYGSRVEEGRIVGIATLGY